jgi:hypothetical protein
LFQDCFGIAPAFAGRQALVQFVLLAANFNFHANNAGAQLMMV